MYGNGRTNGRTRVSIVEVMSRQSVILTHSTWTNRQKQEEVILLPWFNRSLNMEVMINHQTLFLSEFPSLCCFYLQL